jgi:hypothetical protein
LENKRTGRFISAPTIEDARAAHEDLV